MYVRCKLPLGRNVMTARIWSEVLFVCFCRLITVNLETAPAMRFLGHHEIMKCHILDTRSKAGADSGSCDWE